MRLLAILALVAAPAWGQSRALVGLESSALYGESGVGIVGDVSHTARSWGIEAQASTLDKYTHAGWRARGAIDARSAPLFAGLGYSYRDGGEWAKRVVWARCGVTSDHLTLIAAVAPSSPYREAQLEARWRDHIGRAVVEVRGWIGDYDGAVDGYAWGVKLLVGMER
jgi:hypothetical protein